MAKRGRRAGPSDTRAQISVAARRQFSERGYPRTTIRSIAAEAAVDPSLVIHFFGSKQKLFAEVVELGYEPDAIIANIFDGPIEERGKRLARFVVGLLKDPHYTGAFADLLHMASSDPAAANLWRERVRQSVFLPLTRRLGIDQPELRAALAATQTIGLVVTHYILKMDALASLTDDELVCLIGPTLQRYLAEPLARSDDP